MNYLWTCIYGLIRPGYAVPHHSHTQTGSTREETLFSALKVANDTNSKKRREKFFQPFAQGLVFGIFAKRP